MSDNLEDFSWVCPKHGHDYRICGCKRPEQLENKMYLLISLTGDIIKTKVISPNTMEACKKDEIEIIDISNPSNPLYYNNCSNTWDKIV